MAHPRVRAFLERLHDPIERRRLAEILRPGDGAFALRLDRVVVASRSKATNVRSAVNENGPTEVPPSTGPRFRVGAERDSSRERHLERTPCNPR